MVKSTLVASFAFLAVSAVLAPSARACGRPDQHSALSALMPAIGVTARTDMLNRANPSEERETGPQSVVGLWLTTGTIEGQQTQSFEAFTSDGLEVLNDNGSPLEGNVCLGGLAERSQRGHQRQSSFLAL